MTHEVLAAYLLAAGAGMLVAGLAERRIRCNALRRSVFRNLDSAAENGYFAPGEYLDGMPAAEVAYDLTVYSPEHEGAKPETLAPYVREWLFNYGVVRQ